VIDVIRLGKRARYQLISLKRKTGINNWNILCRWAFALSISEKSRPRDLHQPLDGGVEMTWHTFAGEYEEIFEALIRQRCLNDGLEANAEDIQSQLRRHIYRGIGYLAVASRVSNIKDLVNFGEKRAQT